MKENKNIFRKILTIIVAAVMIISLATASFAIYNNNSKANPISQNKTTETRKKNNVDNINSESQNEIYRDVELSEEDKESYSDLSQQDVEEGLEDKEEKKESEVETTQMINPKDVRFMQSSIKNQTGEYTVLGNAEALKKGMLLPTDLALIRLWKDDKGNVWTLDHRRLAAFRLAGLENVPFQWATEEEVKNQMWKMTTRTEGKTIRLKLGNGKSMIVE